MKYFCPECQTRRETQSVDVSMKVNVSIGNEYDDYSEIMTKKISMIMPWCNNEGFDATKFTEAIYAHNTSIIGTHSFFSDFEEDIIDELTFKFSEIKCGRCSLDMVKESELETYNNPLYAVPAWAKDKKENNGGWNSRGNIESLQTYFGQSFTIKNIHILFLMLELKSRRFKQITVIKNNNRGNLVNIFNTDDLKNAWGNFINYANQDCYIEFTRHKGLTYEFESLCANRNIGQEQVIIKMKFKDFFELIPQALNSSKQSGNIDYERSSRLIRGEISNSDFSELTQISVDWDFLNIYNN